MSCCPPSIVPDFSDGGGGGGGGVQTVSGGTNITVSGTPTNPIIDNNGVRTITAGTNINITGTANAPIINTLSSPVSIISTTNNITNSLTTGNATVLLINFTLTQTCNLFINGGLGLISSSTTPSRVIMGFTIDVTPVPNTTISQSIQNIAPATTTYQRITTTGVISKPAGSYTLYLKAYASGITSGTITLDPGTNFLQLITNIL
jgi:hypothetical protein